MSSLALTYFSEPLLRFGHSQSSDDPRNGLFLYGPLSDGRKPKHMRVGVVATPDGIAAYREWVARINRFIPAAREGALHQVGFPGFEAAFQTEWPTEPVVTIAVSPTDIARAIRLADRHVAMYESVSLYIEPIKQRRRSDDAIIDLWFIVVPEAVYTFGRPLSKVPTSERIGLERRINARIANRLRVEPSLFEEDMAEIQVYAYDLDFHDQLKARLLECQAVTQIVRETSLFPAEDQSGRVRQMQDPATIAWNLSTAAFFKAGGRPWKLHELRERVCYIGIVFKVDQNDITGRNACCGAQMFLDSGDGLVFKGAVGKWYSLQTKEFHLSEEKAFELLGSVLDEYERLHGVKPEELFIHSKTRFNDAEWQGFIRAADGLTRIVGIKINRSYDLKAFRPGKTPVLRGTALKIDSRRAYLWTSGYVPRLRTYAGREVPNPLQVEIYKGQADIDQVLTDIMGLTKVNFNACIYSDGLPVTLRFADAVGDILTAGPQTNLPPLPFRHYI
jgi:hypothetical protein